MTINFISYGCGFLGCKKRYFFKERFANGETVSGKYFFRSVDWMIRFGQKARGEKNSFIWTMLLYTKLLWKLMT